MKFNEFVCGVDKETSTETSGNSPVVIDCSSGEDGLPGDNDDPSREGVVEEETSDNGSSVSGVTTRPTTVRRSHRETRRPDYYGEWANSTSSITEPLTLEEGLSCSEKENWREAMQTEFKSLCVNKVWDLVPPPKDCKVINSNQVFKCKLGETGLVERYKARLVTQGYSQRPEIDYEETFSPVVCFALAVHGNLKLPQMDVKTAFLNGELTEEVFMKQPESFVEKGKENLDCRLKQSIYGLKQSPRCWNAALDDHLKKMNSFRQNEIPVSMCPPMENLSVYVDDILIAGRTDERIVLTLRTWEIYTTS